MKLIMLMVLFSTPDNIEPHADPRFGALAMKSVEQCLTRRSFAHKFFKETLREGTRFRAFCVQFEAFGYDEALAAFRADLGPAL